MRKQPITGGMNADPEKVDYAKHLRRNQTPTEARVWEFLRARRFLGLKFRRQQLIQGYIVDFYCADKRLAIELDGAVHDQQKGHDQERDEALAQNNIRVVRIPNEAATREELERLLHPFLAAEK